MSEPVDREEPNPNPDGGLVARTRTSVSAAGGVVENIDSDAVDAEIENGSASSATTGGQVTATTGVPEAAVSEDLDLDSEQEQHRHSVFTATSEHADPQWDSLQQSLTHSEVLGNVAGDIASAMTSSSAVGAATGGHRRHSEHGDREQDSGDRQHRHSVFTATSEHAGAHSNRQSLLTHHEVLTNMAADIASSIASHVTSTAPALPVETPDSDSEPVADASRSRASVSFAPPERRASAASSLRGSRGETAAAA